MTFKVTYLTQSISNETRLQSRTTICLKALHGSFSYWLAASRGPSAAQIFQYKLPVNEILSNATTSRNMWQKTDAHNVSNCARVEPAGATSSNVSPSPMPTRRPKGLIPVMHSCVSCFVSKRWSVTSGYSEKVPCVWAAFKYFWKITWKLAKFIFKCHVTHVEANCGPLKNISHVNVATAVKHC